MRDYSKSINYITISIATGGLLFGFDTAVISGAIHYVQIQFMLDDVLTGWFVSCGLLGCITGVAIVGIISDKLGRKAAIQVAAVTFLVSAIGCGFSSTFSLLIFFRLIGGIGVGIASVVSPMYISEFSTAEKRGQMVTYYQLAITVGILSAYFSNALLVSMADFQFNTASLSFFFTLEPWRPMFLMMALPSVIFLIMLTKVPESPRWLLHRNLRESAIKILSEVNGEEEADNLVRAIENTGKENVSMASIFKSKISLQLFIGITLAVLQQFSGINAIIYYGPAIFKEAGVGEGSALIFQVIVGITNIMFTFIALYYADKLGRKFLLTRGLAGIVVALFFMGILFYTKQTSGVLVLLLTLGFIACFALSVGPVTWIIISEIFPTNFRAKAVSICTLALWAAVWLVGQFFPWLLNQAGPATTFWLFAGFSFVNFLFCRMIVRETKGKSLEEMDTVFISPH